MAEERDLERRLEAMFASARPRRGFEDQLWTRLQRTRPWYRRLGAWLGAPAHLAPALATLVVVAGAGYVIANFHPAANEAATSGSGAAGGGAYRADQPAFGVLPAFGGGKSADSSGAGPTLPAITGGPTLGPVAPVPRSGS